VKKIRVLIVDDSSIIRTLLTKILSSDNDIEVVGTAPDPFIARDKIVSLKPDVMTLDIEMPKMDGVTFLGKVMQHFPIRTIVISSLSVAGSESALKALEAGAVDVVAKPAIDVTKSLEDLGAEIIQRVKMAARAKLIKKVVLQKPKVLTSTSALARTTHQILAIASSTGGTEALKVLLPSLPSDLPGTVIVQHMPPVFTKAYAQHLQQICPFEVKEAEQGDRVIPGRVLLAPGNYHMELNRSGAQYFVELNQKPALHGVRPAADLLMNSVAKFAGSNAIGVVLTGMGKDGAEGLLKMKQAGSFNIAQNEDTCVVFGMPKVAIELKAIDLVCDLDEIAGHVIERIKVTAA
jgi:two-component system chemotaxis response regulator CheB